LEPGGLVEIKYRRPQIIAKMARLDALYISLLERLSSSTPDEREHIKKEMILREEELYPVYHSAALMFSDLHDVPERMLAKGVIKGIVDWKSARGFFYRRLVRRIAEERVIERVVGASGVTRGGARDVVEKLYGDGGVDDKSDEDVSRWLEEHEGVVDECVEGLRKEGVREKVAVFVASDVDGAVRGIREGLEKMGNEERAAFIERLTR
jgi:acetyl-CoA carboxylase/biotin carboxylase 1